MYGGRSKEKCSKLHAFHYLNNTRYKICYDLKINKVILTFIYKYVITYIALLLLLLLLLSILLLPLLLLLQKFVVCNHCQCCTFLLQLNNHSFFVHFPFQYTDMFFEMNYRHGPILANLKGVHLYKILHNKPNLANADSWELRCSIDFKFKSPLHSAIYR